MSRSFEFKMGPRCVRTPPMIDSPSSSLPLIKIYIHIVKGRVMDRNKHEIEKRMKDGENTPQKKTLCYVYQI